MFVLVTYDIADDKRRLQVMKMLRGYGAHVQESVFECVVEGSVYRQMMQRLKELINVDQDNVRLYHLCATDVERVRCLGVGRPVQVSSEYGIV